jgi:methylglyoxal synthase
MAINKSSADFIITSSLMDEEYDHDVINFKENVSKRVKEMS